MTLLVKALVILALICAVLALFTKGVIGLNPVELAAAGVALLAVAALL